MRKTNFCIPLIFLLLFSLSACDPGALLERKSPDDVASAKTYFQLLRQGEADHVEDLFDPSVKGSDFHTEFVEMVATIPSERPSSAKTTGVRVECGEDICKSQVVIQYTYSTEILLFKVSFRQEGGHSNLVGMYIRVIPESLIKANEFGLSNKSFPQYVILLMAIVFPAFCLYVLFLCIRSRIGPRKWIWAVFILVGVSRLAINWTTGQFDLQFLAIQLLSANAFAAPYGPWVVSISVPVGAILFLMTHSRLLREHKARIPLKKTD